MILIRTLEFTSAMFWRNYVASTLRLKHLALQLHPRMSVHNVLVMVNLLLSSVTNDNQGRDAACGFFGENITDV